MKQKICSNCKLEKKIWKREGKELYCQSCWNRIKPSVTTKPSVQKRIKHFSVKKAKENDIYKTVREVYLRNHEFCELRLPMCTQYSTEIHHQKGRIGPLLTNIHFFKATCRTCHTWIELHPQEAIELGFSYPRLNNES